VTAFVYEQERYREGDVQILGVSVEPPEEGKKLRKTARVYRWTPYPVRLLTDPDAKLIRAGDLRRGDHPPLPKSARLRQ